MMVRGLDRVLSIQRPLVLAHIRSIRLRNPHSDARRDHPASSSDATSLP